MESDPSQSQLEGLLGCVPHSIRGSIHTYSQFLPTTPSFPQCTACSDVVLKALEKEKMEFLKNVCNESNYLEDLTGLANLMNEANLDEVIEFDDDDSVSIQSST